MSKYNRIINFSGGKWVEVSAAARALAMSPNRLSGILIGLTSRDIVVHVQRNDSGDVVRYRSYHINDRAPIELAKFRKSLGLTAAMESFKLGVTA